MTPRTIAEAQSYWQRYYSDEFVFGLGTEHILTTLQQIPPTGTWLDLGAGTESLLWSIPLDAQRLIAIDVDPRRLARLQTYAAARRPRGAHQTVLDLCGRSRADFARRCERLTAAVIADCLTGASLPLHAGIVDLVTQFGLLGLTTGNDQFVAAWKTCHEPLTASGWAAGANWNATNARGRVQLSERLYAAAFAHAHMTPLLISRVPIVGDADFDSIWIYLGRKT